MYVDYIASRRDKIYFYSMDIHIKIKNTFSKSKSLRNYSSLYTVKEIVKMLNLMHLN